MIIYFTIVSSTCLSAKKAALKAAFFCIRKDGMRTLEGSLPRSALRSRESLFFYELSC